MSQSSSAGPTVRFDRQIHMSQDHINFSYRRKIGSATLGQDTVLVMVKNSGVPQGQGKIKITEMCWLSMIFTYNQSASHAF